jgi:hypothetical protein
MERKPQNLANHAKFDPAFHFFLAPVALFFIIATGIEVYKNPGWMTAVHLLAALWATVALFKIRLYSLKVQDRVIRLEERLRLERLLSAPAKARVYELTEGQLIALRFASDSEIPVLVDNVFKTNMTPKQIKQAIQSWRPDYWRV